MKYSELIKTKDLLYINKQILSTLFPNESSTNIKIRLSQLAKSGKLIALKRDMYILTEWYNNFRIYPEYPSVIACTLKAPSYLSLEYVLRKYEVLTEGTYGYTLITTKKRDTFENRLGTFSYNEISEDLFIGYIAHSFLEYEYYEATKAKALFDWLYYRTNIIEYEDENVNLVEDLRLNLDSFTKKDLKELKSYTKFAKNKKKLDKIIDNIIRNAHHNK